MLRLSFLGILLWMMMLGLTCKEEWLSDLIETSDLGQENEEVSGEWDQNELFHYYYAPEMPYLAECENINSKTVRRQCSDRKIVKFLMDNFQLPLDSEEGCLKMMVASFIVKIDGTISNPQIRRGMNPEFDRELLRVIQMLPKFVPGKLRGKAIPLEINLPFRIRIE